MRHKLVNIILPLLLIKYETKTEYEARVSYVTKYKALITIIVRTNVLEH